jgi:hypothetical protein
MAPFPRLDLGPNLRTRLGPEYFRNLLAFRQAFPSARAQRTRIERPGVWRFRRRRFGVSFGTAPESAQLVRGVICGMTISVPAWSAPKSSVGL